MTNEQAARWLKDLLKSDLPMEQYQTAIEKGIEALEQRTGHWIFDNFNWRCSECNETPKTLGYVGTADFMTEHFKFCNHCGARMFEPQERSGEE